MTEYFFPFSFCSSFTLGWDFHLWFFVCSCVSMRVFHRRRIGTHACYDFILFYDLWDLTYTHIAYWPNVDLCECLTTWRTLVDFKVKMTLIKLFRVEFIMTTAKYLFIFLWFFSFGHFQFECFGLLNRIKSAWNEKYLFKLCLEKKMTVKIPYKRTEFIEFILASESASPFVLSMRINSNFDRVVPREWASAISRRQNCGARHTFIKTERTKTKQRNIFSLLYECCVCGLCAWWIVRRATFSQSDDAGIYMYTADDVDFYVNIRCACVKIYDSPLKIMKILFINENINGEKS